MLYGTRIFLIDKFSAVTLLTLQLFIDTYFFLTVDSWLVDTFIIHPIVHFLLFVFRVS